MVVQSGSATGAQAIAHVVQASGIGWWTLVRVVCRTDVPPFAGGANCDEVVRGLSGDRLPCSELMISAVS